MNGIAYFIYNGKSSLDYGLRIHNKMEFVIPKRALDILQLEGNGALLLKDKGYYEPIEREFICTLEPVDGISLEGLIEQVTRWLRSSIGFGELSYSKEKGYFYKALSNGLIRIDTSVSPYAELSISFLCHPFRFLAEGKHSIILDNGASIHNLGTEESKPRMVFELKSASSAFEFSITDSMGKIKFFTFLAPQVKKVIIDCESYEIISEDGMPLYHFAEFWQFPLFPSGTFSFSFSSNVSSVMVIPRWCKI